MNSLLMAALKYKAMGYSVIAVKENKKSLQYWKGYQKKIISKKALKKMFSNRHTHGIAIVCGKVSGNLEVIDMDAINDPTGLLYSKFILSVYKVSSNLLDRLVIAKSRNSGFHFFYKCQGIESSCALAKRPTTKDELRDDPEVKTKVLIETRGEGGYILVWPSPGYRFIQGDLASIVTISPAERNKLFEIAKSFHQYPPAEIFDNRPKKMVIDEESPFEDYNRRGDVIQLLVKHGWTVVKTVGLKTFLKRPGQSDHETSGDYHHGLGLFGVFSTNTVFRVKKGYKPYAVYAILECNGNFTQAAQKLLAEGYGISYKDRL